MEFVSKVTSLLFNKLSWLVIAFLPRSKCLLISWLQSPSAMILEPHQKIKSVTVSIVPPSICHAVIIPGAMILVFWMLSFKPALSLSSFTFIKKVFSSSSLSGISVVLSAYLRLLLLLLTILIPAWASSVQFFSFPSYKLIPIHYFSLNFITLLLTSCTDLNFKALIIGYLEGLRP